jgi:hypothetical protein
MPTTHVIRVSAIRMRTARLLLGYLLTTSCVGREDPGDDDTVLAVADLTPCPRPIDSARVARLALDTVTKTYGVGGRGFESIVLRYEPDSVAGFVRIVTMAQPRGHVIDGIAVVRMDCDGRVFDLVLTDSA